MERVRHILDLGGGVDAGKGKRDGPMLPDSVISMGRSLAQRPLRGAWRAERDAATTVTVVDAKIPQELEDFYRRLPNLRFIEHEVRADSSLPFDSDYFNEVEINFGFRPFNFEQLIQYESSDQWLESLRMIADVPVYRRALEEAGRVLKLDGRLALCERQENMDAIRRILDNSPEFLSDCGLQMGSFTEITEISDDLSPQALASLNAKRELEQAGRHERSNAYRIYSLELVKSS